MQSPGNIPTDYPLRVKDLRERLGLTQVEMAARIGVAFATVNRWENGKSRPAALAWQRLVDLDAAARAAIRSPEPPVQTSASLDFAARSEVVAAVAEGTRLAYGHLFNPTFAAEISSIDPLPHQRIAVYEHMLQQSPLRFLLADDAGAGKTIMTGLYLREVMARQLVSRVLIVPPAGLVGNWEREMRTLFRLPFRVVRGAEARTANPFSGPDSDRLIVSVDTLAGTRMFRRLREAVAAGARPYELVVFDEAHKLAAHRGHDSRVHKTERYRLAEALAGLPVRDERWTLGWSALNVLLLTATPHMGKDFPYYCLWRLLAPDALATFEAFEDFPDEQRRRHFIRRTKEEMVGIDGRPLYPQRHCDTLSHSLSPAEQALYDATTRYIAETYSKARVLNRSAARLAMSVFQRRLASSSHALMRSFERRLARMDEAIALVQEGRSDELERRQVHIGETVDVFESRTADEETGHDGEQEAHEAFEEAALGGLAAVALTDLREERAEVEALLARARELAESGEDSKLEKLRDVMANPAFGGEKLIVFSEHRDTVEFVVRRLEGFGLTGRVALIHGGLGYREREAQVELFRRPADHGGANCLVATDAAGEGINLQFCWLMVNYDVPWNPARLEQRMGRIHRYGQKRDPVVIVNLVAGETREGRVLTALLEKLEAIRKQLSSDKVFDVVGRLFENMPLKDYFEQAATEDGAREAIEALDRRMTPERTAAIAERERDLYGVSEVRDRLPEINAAMERERFRRMLPGYVRRFVETGAPLLDLRVEGDAGGVFELVPQRRRAADELREAMDMYPEEMWGRLTVHRPKGGEDAIWMHPGEAVFERFRGNLLARHRAEARRGAIFVDPHAEVPYLFHLARASVRRRDGNRSRTVETRLIGLRQSGDGAISACALEHILLLRGAERVAPGSVPLAHAALGLKDGAEQWLRHTVLGMVAEHRARIQDTLPERRRWVTAGYHHRTADLMQARRRASAEARGGDPRRLTEFDMVKEQQGRLAAERQRALSLLEDESSLIEPGEATMIAHALVVPTEDREERQRHDAEVEAIAMAFARVHEEAAGAKVDDVSRPDLSRREGLGDWPGFDLRSVRPAGDLGPAEDRAIEVKGRAGTGAVEVSANEWAAACNLRERYWLYTVFDCATPRPRLVKVRDPFGRLLAKAKGSVVISASEIQAAGTREAGV